MYKEQNNQNDLAKFAKYIAVAGIAIPVGYCLLVITGVAEGGIYSAKEMLTNAGIMLASLEICAGAVWICSKLRKNKSK